MIEEKIGIDRRLYAFEREVEDASPTLPKQRKEE